MYWNEGDLVFEEQKMHEITVEDEGVLELSPGDEASEGLLEFGGILGQLLVLLYFFLLLVFLLQELAF